jgi:aryl-alcohol dehydrogenase-like predicted oxidoreductase
MTLPAPTRTLGGLTVSALGLGCMDMLAWLLAQGGDIAPFPGTKKRSRLEEHLGALEVELTADELAPVGVAAGDRSPDMSSVGC